MVGAVRLRWRVGEFRGWERGVSAVVHGFQYKSSIQANTPMNTNTNVPSSCPRTPPLAAAASWGPCSGVVGVFVYVGKVSQGSTRLV